VIRVAKQLLFLYFIESTSSPEEDDLHKHIYQSALMTAPIADVEGSLRIAVSIGIYKIAAVVRLFFIFVDYKLIF